MKFGLIGGKLGHSYSPKIHQLFFDRFSINASYDLFELTKENLSEFCQNVRNGSLEGFNITIPYKEDIFSLIDSVDPKAEKIGAINTIKNKHGELIGYNTDYYGYLYSVQKLGINLSGERVVILGNGGSAKAVIEVSKDLGAKEIFLVSRNPEKQAPTGVISISYEALNTLGQGTLITNCTPCGMYPKVDISPIKKELFSNYNYAIDLIYNPKETLFLNYAKTHGLKTLNGLYMLLGQAIKAEEIWQEKTYSLDVIDELYEKLEDIVYGGK